MDVIIYWSISMKTSKPIAAEMVHPGICK